MHFFIGKSQAKTDTITATETETVYETITKEVIPEGYINTSSKEFFDNYIDMSTVTDFIATETGLQLYTNDGNGYYWEK